MKVGQYFRWKIEQIRERLSGYLILFGKGGNSLHYHHCYVHNKYIVFQIISIHIFSIS